MIVHLLSSIQNVTMFLSYLKYMCLHKYGITSFIALPSETSDVAVYIRALLDNLLTTDICTSALKTFLKHTYKTGTNKLTEFKLPLSNTFYIL